MPGRTEHREQVDLVARIRAFYPDALLFSVPNGGLRDRRVAARMKAEGVLAGVPDLFLAEPRGRYAGLFVEVKRADGRGRLSAAQRRVIERLEVAGYAIVVADSGVDDAFAEVERYLALDSGPCAPRVVCGVDLAESPD